MGDSTDVAANLSSRWSQLCVQLNVEAQDAQKWWPLIQEHHGEPHRRYHTLTHIAEMFGHVDEHIDKITDTAAVSLAIFFHDIIYNPKAGSPQNEQDSAVLFEQFGQQSLPAGHPPGLEKGNLISKVRRWIVQTASHKVSESDDNDCKLFMDFDMAVLGRSWEQYELYSQQIRAEYSHIPDIMFWKGRSAFLASTSQGDAIFATAIFRDTRLRQAQENMKREAALLRERYESAGLLTRAFTESCYSKDLKKWSSVLAKAGGIGLVLAACFKRPRWAFTAGVTAAACAALFKLRLKFGAKYVQHPYPEPPRAKGTVILAGSYNPPHLGHLEMLKYLSKAHEVVHAVIGANPSKTYDVNPYQRQEILRAQLKETGVVNVEVIVYGGIIFRHAKSIGASTMYRGIRTWEEDGKAEKYLEFQNLYYQFLSGWWPIPTAYLQGDPKLRHVSSTLLRKRIADKEDISDLVTAGTVDAVSTAYGPNSSSSG